MGVSQPTIRKWLQLSEEEFDNAYAESKSVYSKYREYILSLLQLRPDIRTTTIWHRLQEDFPEEEFKKTGVFRYVKSLREEAGFDKSYHRKTSMREELPPGYEAQVDFGQVKMLDMFDRTIPVYFFCMVLSYSRMRYVYFSHKPFTTDTAIQAHNHAFRYFGGRTQTIMYDQDRVFVVSENLGNIMLVPEFEQYVRRIGFGVVLCRPSDPQTKGKVENFVKNVKEGFLSGRIYTGIDSINSAAIRWLDDTANEWQHGVTKQTPREMFREESKYLVHVPIQEVGLHYKTVSHMYSLAYDNCTYVLPQSAVNVGQRIRIEERDGMLYFYETISGERKYQCRKSTNIGEVVSCDKESVEMPSATVNTIRHQFGYSDLIEHFIGSIEASNPRYKSVQYGRIAALCRAYTLEQVQTGIEHCLKVDRCSASELTAYLMLQYGLRQSRIRLSYYEQKKCRELAEQIQEEMENGEY